MCLVSPEHTWGGDVKKYLHDETHWLNDDFHALQYNASNFLKITAMWQEQRDWGIAYPLQAVPPAHPLAAYLTRELHATAPTQPSLKGYTRLGSVASPMRLGGFSVAFNGSTGGVSSLLHTATGKQFAGASNPIGVFEYKVHAASEYERFFAEYAQRIDGKIPSYFPLDFGKPGLYNNSIIANATVALGVLKEAYLKNGSDAGEQVRERERVCVYVCMCVCVCMYMCVSV